MLVATLFPLVNVTIFFASLDVNVFYVGGSNVKLLMRKSKLFTPGKEKANIKFKV